MTRRLSAVIVLVLLFGIGFTSQVGGTSARGSQELSLRTPLQPAKPICGDCICWAWYNVSISYTQDWEDSTISWPGVVGVDSYTALQEAYDTVNLHYCGVWRAASAFLVESDGACPLDSNHWAPMRADLWGYPSGADILTAVWNYHGSCDTWQYFYTSAHTSLGCFYSSSEDTNDPVNFTVYSNNVCQN